MLIVIGSFTPKSINLHSSRWQLCDSFVIISLAFIFSGLHSLGFRFSGAIFSILSTYFPFYRRIFDFIDLFAILPTGRLCADRARSREFCGGAPPGAADLLGVLDFRAFRRVWT